MPDGHEDRACPSSTRPYRQPPIWTSWTAFGWLYISLTKGARVVVTGRLEQRSWESDEGDKRSKVEIVADEIGASLRFATVDIHKVQRPATADEPADEAASA